MRVVYLHGFASSPASSKAVFLERQFAESGIPFYCPNLNEPDFSTLTTSRMVDQVVRLASDEDVDLVGVSSLSTDHLIVPDLMQALRKAALEHVPVVVGGIVPDTEHALLFDAGVSAIFGPGTARDTIVNTVRQLAAAARDVLENPFT